MDLDMAERARAGDRDAFRALITLWGTRLLRTAVLVTGDRGGAERALSAALTRTWAELPSMHSERAFRPWLFARLVDGALEKRVSDEAAELPAYETCLRSLDPQVRALLLLHLHDGMGAPELALMRETHIGTAIKGLRAAQHALGSCLEQEGLDETAMRAMLADAVSAVELPAWFFDEVLAARLSEPEGPEVRRLLRIDPRRAWRVVIDPANLPAWATAENVRARGAPLLEPGVRIAADGRIAGARRSRDESLVTRAGDDQVLAWTTRSHVPLRPGAIEFRWTMQVLGSAEGCELVHRLRGVAFPSGMAGRALQRLYERLAPSMHASMHAGLERLAQTIELRAARAPL